MEEGLFEMQFECEIIYLYKCGNGPNVTHGFMFAYAHEEMYILLSVLSIFSFFLV